MSSSSSMRRRLTSNWYDCQWLVKILILDVQGTGSLLTVNTYVQCVFKWLFFVNVIVIIIVIYQRHCSRHWFTVWRWGWWPAQRGQRRRRRTRRRSWLNTFCCWTIHFNSNTYVTLIKFLCFTCRAKTLGTGQVQKSRRGQQRITLATWPGDYFIKI